MGFWQLTVPTSPDTSEGFTNFLWEQGALGVVEEEGPAEPPRVRAFFPDSASSTGLVAGVAAYAAELRALGFTTAPGQIEIAPLVEEAWASAWQQSFPARAIGRRLWVRPSWERAESRGRVTVVIEPGRAFGTGHHGSTEGCLALLDAAVGEAPPDLVLDIGTGTGILAIACLKLGAPRVLGLDIDPDAIAAARRNATTAPIASIFSSPAPSYSRTSRPSRSSWPTCSPTPTSPWPRGTAASSPRVAISSWAASWSTRTPRSPRRSRAPALPSKRSS